MTEQDCWPSARYAKEWQGHDLLCPTCKQWAPSDDWGVFTHGVLGEFQALARCPGCKKTSLAQYVRAKEPE